MSRTILKACETYFRKVINHSLEHLQCKIKSLMLFGNCFNSFSLGMKFILLTTLFALSIANYDFGFKPPRKSVRSSKKWSGGCRIAKCPKDEDFCVNPRCYPHKEIEKALEDSHLLKVHQDLPRSSGNHSKIFS